MAVSDEELQQTWEERINRAKVKREEWKKTFKVDMAQQYFMGQQNPGYPPDEWLTINKIYAHLMSQLPTLYSMDPYFYVRLKKSYQVDPQAIAMYEARGKVRQSYLNYLRGELELKEKARMAIQQAHFSYGVLKTRYAVEEQENPRRGQKIMSDDGVPLRDDEGNELEEPDTIPVNQRYATDWIDADDILFDEDAGPLPDSWKWIGQRVNMTRGEAKNIRRYKTSVVESIQRVSADEQKRSVFGTVSAVFQPKADRRAKTDPDDEPITFWEIYHLKERKWLTVAEQARELIATPDKLPPGVELHPFHFLRFTLLEKSPYPLPPLSQGIDPQREFNLARSGLVVHRKRFNRKYECVRNRLEDEEQASKLESGDDGTIIFVKERGAIEPIQDAPLDQSTYTEIGMLNNDMVEVLGSPDQARGIGDAESATEASLLDKRLEVREGDRMSLVVDFVKSWARGVDRLVQTHIERDEAVKITGPQGEFWQTVRAEDYEDIEGEFEYAVNVGATRPRLPDIERSQWIAFMSQVVIPFPHILTMPSVMKRMAEMFHIEDDAALEELRQMGLKMLSGQAPMPGANQGSQPGVSDNNPITKILGEALGQQGGNVNGGGSPMVQQ